MSARHSMRCTTPVAGCSKNEANAKEEKARGCTDLIPSCIAQWGEQRMKVQLQHAEWGQHGSAARSCHVDQVMNTYNTAAIHK
jgi:hypothetical protein